MSEAPSNIIVMEPWRKWSPFGICAVDVSAADPAQWTFITPNGQPPEGAASMDPLAPPSTNGTAA